LQRREYVTPLDSPTFVLMPFVLMVAGLLASIAPAAKATQVDLPELCSKSKAYLTRVFPVNF